MEIDPKLIEIITEEVVSVLKKDMLGFGLLKNSLQDALVLGGTEYLPQIEKKKYNFYSKEALVNADDVKKYQKVFITEMSLSNLADIALGRDETEFSKIVITAMFNNIDIAILDSAFIHTKYQNGSNRAYFLMYEEYVRKLKSFGIQILSANIQTKYSKCPAPDPKLPKNVVTEAVAKKLVYENPQDVISICAGAIVTPSAKDIFNQAGKIVVIR